MLVFVSSTVSLSVFVCASVEGGLEGGGPLETDISSGVICFAVCFSAAGFSCIRLRRNSEPLVVLTTYDRGSSSLSLTSAAVQGPVSRKSRNFSGDKNLFVSSIGTRFVL